MSLLQQHRPSESYLRTLPLGTHPKDHESRLPTLSMAPDRAVRSSLPLAEISGEVTFTLSERQKQQLVLGLSVRKSRASQANSLVSITSRKPCDSHHRLRRPSLLWRPVLPEWLDRTVLCSAVLVLQELLCYPCSPSPRPLLHGMYFPDCLKLCTLKGGQVERSKFLGADK